MTKRALLIGSPFGGLSGVETDVRTVDEMLGSYGFEIQQCIGIAATREGILDSYNQLIDNTAAEDAAVVYYSGHGARAVAPEDDWANQGDAPIAKYYQFIVPIDIDQSSNEDFRGITNLELSVLMAKLTEKTKNVTVILDCCHAARMSRGLNMTARALPRAWYVGVRPHLERLRAKGIEVDRLDVESNRNAVRLVAAGPNQSAYEYTNSDGQTIGMLTESLRIALQESQGLPVTWDALGGRIRNRVLSLEHTQRPEVEGPTSRLLFDAQTVEQTGVLEVSIENGRPVLHGGRILGVEVGDEYGIMPLTAREHDPGAEIARATISKVMGSRSEMALDFRGANSSVPDGARAFPVRRALHKVAIRIQGEGAGTSVLRNALRESSHLCLLAEDDRAEELAVIDVSENQISLLDHEGRRMVFPKPFTDEKEMIRQTCDNLKQFAQAYNLRTLTKGKGAFELRQPVDVEWGIVKGGQGDRLPETGALLYVNDSVYVRIHNKGMESVYTSVFDIGLGGRITLLSTSEPSGIEVAPRQDYILGYSEHDSLVGLPLKWSDTVPDDGPRPESLVVIISDKPQELRAFEQRGMRAIKGPPESQLQQILSQYAQGVLRDLSPDTGGTDVRYTVRHIDFLVAPGRRPPGDEPTFLIDERPAPGFLWRSHKGGERPPERVAVRLKEAIVHRNRALFSTEVRIDSLVMTGSAEATECYRAETARFPQVKDGDRLSFDNLLVYQGPAAGFLDIAVWISRDRKDSLSLADMLKDQLNSSEFKEAAVVLAGMAVAAPQAATIVAATGAAATLVNIGYRLLSAVVGNSIGLYRTSFLAHERFGVGQHPEHSMMRAQDFSFCYEVLAVD